MMMHCTLENKHCNSLTQNESGRAKDVVTNECSRRKRLMMNYEASKLNLLTFDRNRSRYVITKVVNRSTVPRYSKPTISPEKRHKKFGHKMSPICQASQVGSSFFYFPASSSKQYSSHAISHNSRYCQHDERQ